MNREKIILKTEKPVQENYLGANAVYHCYATLPDSTGRAYTEEECALEFERVKKCGLKIARTFFRWYGWDKEKQCFDWENEPYIKGFYKWAKAMQEIGTDIALQVGWWCPEDVIGRGPNGDSPFNKDDNWENSVQNYAKWVSEVAHQLIEVRGFTNIKYFMMFTEPQRPSRRYNIEGKSPYEAWRDCVVAAHNQLVKDNRRHLVKFVGPDEGSTTTSDMVKWVAENCDEVIDIYSSHNYISYEPILPEDIHSGGTSFKLFQSIHRRAQCKVALKPDTEYEISVWLKLHSTSCRKISGDFIVGLYDLEPQYAFFHAGTDPDTRLNPDSATTIDESLITDQWQKFTVNVYNEKATEGYFGFMHMVNEEDGVIAIDDFSLKEVGSEIELLPDGGFEASKDMWEFVGKDNLQTADTYYSWLKWAKTGLQYVPDGKTYWFDEYNWSFGRNSESPVDNAYLLQDKTRGVEFAVANTAFINAGVQSSLLWTLFDQQWPDNKAHNINNYYYGDHRWGIMPCLKRTEVPYPAYYAFSLLSRYLGGSEGTKAYAGVAPDLISASVVEAPNGDVTILIVNKRREYVDFELDLGKFSEKTFNRHIYNPWDIFPNKFASIIGIDKVFESCDSLNDKLPPISFAVYTTRND